jgi:hypothetical protein
MARLIQSQLKFNNLQSIKTKRVFNWKKTSGELKFKADYILLYTHFFILFIFFILIKLKLFSES